VTENLKHFPENLTSKFGINAISADAFIADTITLAPERAVPAIKRMRERLRDPAKTADLLLIDMEAAGLIETVDALRAHRLSL